MSRNVRRKAPTTAPARAAGRRGSDSSSLDDLSDDEGYSGVEDVSDSEDDDEEDVNAVEEENILTEAQSKAVGAPRPLPTTEHDDDDEVDDDDDDDDEDEDDEDEVAGAIDPDVDDNASWAGIMSDVDDSLGSDFYQEATAFTADAAVERHVRFDVPSSDSDSTDTEEDPSEMFPDIFVSQNSLDPAFRREIENDPDDSGSGSFWDHEGQYEEQPESEAEEVIRQLSDDDGDTPVATPVAARLVDAVSTPVPAFEEPQELDGYETDGDTTEEDIPEPPVRRKSRRPSHSRSEASDSGDDGPIQTQRGKPRIGRFNLDRSDRKPIAVLNPLTRKMMIFTPHRRRQLDLSPEQFNFQWPLEEQSSPILSNSANMMLSAMFSSNTFGDFINTQAMGPAEAFFPFPTEGIAVGEGSTGPSDADDDDAEKKLDISDFITWGDGASSGEEGEDNDWEPSSTPARPTTASSELDVLSHLNSETVGAFRRNQINQQLILSNQATQDSLAFSGPYNLTALKGLRSDRFDTATSPLTPVRRHRKHASSVGRGPLESPSVKRKASAEVDAGHKRHRSISDVNYLRI